MKGGREEKRKDEERRVTGRVKGEDRMGGREVRRGRKCRKLDEAVKSRTKEM